MSVVVNHTNLQTPKLFIKTPSKDIITDMDELYSNISLYPELSYNFCCFIFNVIMSELSTFTKGESGYHVYLNNGVYQKVYRYYDYEGWSKPSMISDYQYKTVQYLGNSYTIQEIINLGLYSTLPVDILYKAIKHYEVNTTNYVYI